MTDENRDQTGNLDDLYQRLIQINQEAFAGEYYDVAYHALAAALQCAQHLKNIQYLVDIERLANEQLNWIDAHHPEFEHSTQSAAERSHKSIYYNLASQAKTRALMIQRDAEWQNRA
ncbi:MAG: hypothetical protein KJ077_14860 [Anaerolineae bacterium]|nr:hypothetical protein [Anaerolineae bacterium]